MQKITPWIDDQKIIVIKGSRQVGKTTMLFLLQDYLKTNKSIAERNIVYSAADILPQQEYLKTPALFVKYLKDQHRFGKEKLYVFIDEFQYIKQAGQFLKNIFDQHKNDLQLFVSGSSSLEISKNTEFLTGRKIEFTIRGISFKEFLSAKSKFTYKENFELKENNAKKINEFLSIYREDLKLHFWDYLNWGGYPEVALEINLDKKQLILKDIVNTYLQKDIVNFLHIENVDAFNNLATILAAQIGNLMNKHELSNTISLNQDTLNKYLKILQSTYILSLIKPYHTNIRKELSKMPKVYFNDVGLRNLVLQKNGTISSATVEGSLIENFVYNELMQEHEGENIFFYRTISGAEIDFVIRKSGKLIAIEVKFRKKGYKKSIIMDNFKNYYPELVNKQIIITQDDFEFSSNIFYIPAYIMAFINFE